MSKTQTESTETQQTEDLSSALEDISSELFGQGDEGGDKESDAAEGEQVEQAQTADSPATAAAEPAPRETVAENSEEVQETGAPKTWTKEALAEWATLPPRAQQEILKREEDYFRGISQYKTAAEVGQRYDSVVEPYRPILAAENIDPVQLFQSFAANHYLLSRGTPEQKTQLVSQLIQGYGIDFNALAEYIGSQGLDQIDPQITALRQELAAVKNTLTGQQTQQQQATEARLLQEVEAFAADPAHPYFNDLIDDISQLMKAGLATDLQTAYDKAVFANPTTREKAIAALTAANPIQAAEATLKDKIAKATAADVTTSQTQRNGTVPVGSMDDTLTATLASIESRG